MQKSSEEVVCQAVSDSSCTPTLRLIVSRGDRYYANDSVVRHASVLGETLSGDCGHCLRCVPVQAVVQERWPESNGPQPQLLASFHAVSFRCQGLIRHSVRSSALQVVSSFPPSGVVQSFHVALQPRWF